MAEVLHQLNVHQPDLCVPAPFDMVNCGLGREESGFCRTSAHLWEELEGRQMEQWIHFGELASLLAAVSCLVSSQQAPFRPACYGRPQTVCSSHWSFPRYEPGIWTVEVLVVHSQGRHQQGLCLEHAKWPRKQSPWGSSWKCSEGHEDAILISVS